MNLTAARWQVQGRDMDTWLPVNVFKNCNVFRDSEENVVIILKKKQTKKNIYTCIHKYNQLNTPLYPVSHGRPWTWWFRCRTHGAVVLCIKH